MSLITDQEIITLIDNGLKNRTETTNLEFKDARGGIPGSLWKTISSFSHKPKGGVIIFGMLEDRVNDKISIVDGLDLALLQEKIASLLNSVMTNHGASDIRIIEYESHQLLALIIDETPDEMKPCFNNGLGLPRGACIREGNTDRTITVEEMKSFIRNSSLYKFDKTPASSTTIEMISEEKVRSFLKKSAVKVGRHDIVDNNPTPEVMQNLGIIDDFDGRLYPTVAGYLIFSKEDPQKIRSFSRYVIHCITFKGDSPASPIVDKQDIGGTLDQQIDLMRKFILRNIPLKATIEGTKRVEKYEYPADAIRELVANAVIHRDYTITETFTNISIFSNRIEISNPGNLPPGVTIENIKEAQFSRNEIIAEILKDMDYLEEYGRGIDIVFSLMNDWGLLKPIFKNMSNSFKVTLLGEMFKGLNDRQIEIWQLAQEQKRITSKLCQEKFDDISRQTLVSDLSRLVDVGLLEQRGIASTTFYESKY